MILKYDTSFNLSFPVGKKFIIAQFHLKCGEEVSSAVDQFMNEYEIPCYFKISLLNTIESLIKQDKILTKDNDDINTIYEIEQEEHQQEQHLIEQLSNQYSEKIQYWNKKIQSKESEEQQQQEERISTFLYLVDKNSETRERIINQEELFATETSILLVKKQDDFKQLNEKHSHEMEHAFRNSLPPDQVELIVANNMKQVDEFDNYYNHEITMLKQKQKQEFTKFLNDLYWLEKTKDDLDEIESFNKSTSSPSTTTNNTNVNNNNNSNQQTQTQQPQLITQQSSGSILDSIGQNLDKGVSRASSFFSFGFNKNKQINSPPLSSTPGNANNTNSDGTTTQTKPIGINNNNNSNNNNKQLDSPPNSYGSTSSSPRKQTVTTSTNNNNNNNDNSTINNNNNSTNNLPNINNNNNSTNNLPNINNNNTNIQQTRKQSTGSNNLPILSPSKNEEFIIGVGVQKKKIFNFKLIEESPLQLCRPITSLTGDYKKSKRVDYIKTLYSDSLSAVILIIDPSLSFSSENEKKFIKYCNMSTELHFDSIDTQIYNFKQSLLKEGHNNNNGTQYLSNGDFFITKHSNLSDVQVVFHLVIDSKNRTPLGSDNQLTTTSDISKGLRNILLTASKYGIGNITIPICLTESELDLNITNNNLISRCVSVLSVTRASLTSLQEMTSIKTVQFSLPSQLDSGNQNFKGPIAQKFKSAIYPFLYLINQ